MNISIVIPNYNSEKLLVKNIPKLISVLGKYSRGEVELIICDDASTDNSLKVLEDIRDRNSSKVSIIVLKSQLSKNQGFSANVNRGVDKARGEVVILLNTDITVEHSFLTPLLAHFKNELVFAVGCMDKSMENEKIVLRGRGVASWSRGFLLHRKGELNKTNTLWASGGSSAFRKSIWEKLGGLDTLYNPFYWEDVDLSYRALKCGYEVLFEKDSEVLHSHDEGVISQEFSDYNVKTIAYRNQFIFVWKNITDRSLLLNHFLFLPYNLLLAIIHLDTSFLTGFLLAILKLNKILINRGKIKKNFKLTDLQIINSHLS